MFIWIATASLMIWNIYYHVNTLKHHFSSSACMMLNQIRCNHIQVSLTYNIRYHFALAFDCLICGYIALSRLYATVIASYMRSSCLKATHANMSTHTKWKGKKHNLPRACQVHLALFKLNQIYDRFISLGKKKGAYVRVLTPVLTAHGKPSSLSSPR